MKTLKIFYSILFLSGMLFVSACERDNPDPGGTAAEKMAGEFWVQFADFPGIYMHLFTYNTSANSSTEMWFDSADIGGFYSTWQVPGSSPPVLYGGGSLKTKVSINLADLSFSGSNLSSEDPDFIDADENPLSVNITGKILKGVSKGPVSGAVTDSIYMEVEFLDDPGTIYPISGYARTRFAEDDH